MALKGRPSEYFDELEIMSQRARRAYLNGKLAQTVDYAYRHAPAVKEIFDKAGITPDQILTLKDLEKVPIIRKTDLIERQKARPPYGGFLAVPAVEVDRVFLSPGPIYEPIQTASIKWFAKSFYAAGFRKGDIVLNTFTYHMSPAGILFHEALRDCGATVVPTGTGNTEIQIQTMRDLKVNGFVGTPSFLMTVLKRAEELGLNVRKDLCLKRAWFTGEMLAPSLRAIFEKEYKINTYQTYAVTEPGGALAYECFEKSGMHLMDEYVIEIVDLETGRQLGAEEVGEIVITPIHNKQWGLIRFGTGDLSSYTSKPCRCGRTSGRLLGIVGRAGDAVKVRGMFVVGKQAEQVVLGFEAAARYQIVVTREEQRDEIALKIELKPEAAHIDKGKLSVALNKKFQDVCRIKLDRIEFVVVPEGAKKLLDERRWD